MDATTPWFVEAFRAHYLEVYPHRDVESARREAGYLRGFLPSGRVLDLCCGFGRHCLALRELGFDVVGVDLSFDLLARARALPRAELLAGRLWQSDARRLPLAAGSLDAVISLFSSFGYFGAAGDAAVLGEVFRVLRASGTLVIDLMNPAHVRDSLMPFSRTQRDGFVLEERRALLDGGRRVTKDVRVVSDAGAVREWREDVRMYSRAEIAELLAACGFEVLRVHGDFDGAELGPASRRQIVHARKRAPHG